MKVRILLVMCLIISLLCACGQQDYKIYADGGKWYMEFADKEYPSYYISDYPVFKSVSNLKRTLKRGNLKLSDQQIDSIRSPLKGTEDNIMEICNLDHMCELSTPDGVQYADIVWTGGSYKFRFHDNGWRGAVWSTNQEAYDRCFENYYLNAISENYTVSSDTMIVDRNARVVYYTSGGGGQKSLFYKITVGESELYVHEQYLVEYIPGVSLNLVEDEISETIPRNVYIFKSDGINYMYGHFFDLKERPSVEWLSSFHLIPLK